MHHLSFRPLVVLNNEVNFKRTRNTVRCAEFFPFGRGGGFSFCTLHSSLFSEIPARLFEGSFAILRSPGLPFFVYSQKIFVNNLCLNRGLLNLLLQPSFYFQERRCMSIQEAVKIWKMPTDALVYF